MGKLLLVGFGIVLGYSFGYRDARSHPNHILSRAVQVVRTTFNAKPANDIDAVMTKVEGKN